MKSKFAVSIFVTILVLQPLIAMVGVGAEYTPVEMRSVFSGAQDPGVRLSPGELTNHVPVIINKTNDFVSQGWPGSGSELDPYKISGLSIVADVDLTCIIIRNTTAHFLIQDCYIDQGSNFNGIILENTTHGTIEYTTVLSEGPGIDAINSNNTLISHVYSEAIYEMALHIENSTDWTSEYNTFNSTWHRAFRADGCLRVNSMNNHYRNYKTGWFTTIFDNCNFTTSTNDYFEGGEVDAIRMMYCWFTSISGAGVYDQDEGFEFLNCVNVTITDCTMEMLTDEGIILSNSPNVTITNVHVIDTLTSGFYFNNDSSGSGEPSVYPSENIKMRNCNVENAGTRGIYADTIEHLFISGLTLINIGSDGVYLRDSNYLSIIGGSFSEVGGTGIDMGDCDYLFFDNLNMDLVDNTGIYGDTCHNGSITNSIFQEIGNHGVDIGGENWTVSGNTFNEVADTGIDLGFGPNKIVHHNTLSMIDAEGIYLDYCPDSNVYENTITDCTDDAISVSDSERSTIVDNSMLRCYSGIYVGVSENSTILDNTLLDITDSGIDIYDADGLFVANNIVTGARVGINTYLHYNLTFDYNALTDCGFFFGGDFPIIYYEYNMTGNTVNGLPVYFGLHETSGSIDGTTYGQVLLVNCTNFNITGGTFDHITIPIELLHCEYIDINDLTSYRNGYALYLYLSDNVTISNVYVDGYISESTSSYGVYASYSDDIIIQDSTFTRCYISGAGSLYFSDCVDVDILNCDVSYGYRGMYFDDTANVTILDSDILHNEYSGIQFWDDPCQYIHIERNFVYNSTRGIYGDQASQWIVRNNTVMHNTLYGMYFGSNVGDYGNISLNIVESNRDGIYVSGPDYFYIYNNIIRWNTLYGVYLTSSDFTEVYYNIIAFSGTDNAVDGLSGMNWNSTTLGNWWDDFTPPAPYYIDGDSTDEHPMVYLPTEPIIDQPMDYSYAEGDEGNTITWLPVDDSLKNWELWIDIGLWDSDAWDFTDVTVNVDGLPYGTHTATLTIWDVDMNSVSDTVLIHVYDDTPPTISNVGNQWAFEDATGQTATWIANDLHPGEYIFYIDDVLIDSGTWSSGELIGSLDGLTEGEHYVQMVVYDLDGNGESDGFHLRVIDDDTPPTIDSPVDLEYIEGTTGMQIVWTPEDEYPDSFEVRFNGSVVVSGEWGGSRVVVNLDWLGAGTHEFELTVFDGSGNSDSDEVIVSVIPIIPQTTPPPPADLTLLLIVGAVGGAAVVLIVIVFYIRKRRAT